MLPRKLNFRQRKGDVTFAEAQGPRCMCISKVGDQISQSRRSFDVLINVGNIGWRPSLLGTPLQEFV